MKKVLTLILPFLFGGCLELPEGVAPVQAFMLDQYLGKWYEIARLDHRFERGLNNVTAEYSLKGDGGVIVRNRGFLEKKGEWRDAEGKAYFVGDQNVAHLKVSFFGPFYGSYAVFKLDPDYQYAFVSGGNTNYLWLLAREPHVDQKVVDDFVSKAQALGFNTDDLIFVHHNS